ncbi:MAG TPA: serine hydrolase [Bacteroidales bacterium]
MKKIFFLFYTLLLFSCTSNGQKTEQPDTVMQIPFKIDSSAMKPLLTYASPNLQAKLNAMISADPKIKKLVAQKKMAIGLVLLNDTSNVRYARVNGRVEMYAASLPKIAILLSAMDALEKGELQYSDDLRNDMHLMISRSDNNASTRIMDMLGYEKIASVLMDPKYRLYDEEMGGGLWVGKRYAKTGSRYPDPLHGISHAATVTQVCRFYYLLVYGQLVSYERSKEMLAIMQDPALHHKFVNSLLKLEPKAKLFRKSGSWDKFHSDSILVWGPEEKYILVALVEDPDGESILRKLVYEIEDIVRSVN